MTKKDAPKNEDVKKDDPEQSRRFVETATQLVGEANDTHFESALLRVAKSPKKAD